MICLLLIIVWRRGYDCGPSHRPSVTPSHRPSLPLPRAHAYMTAHFAYSVSTCSLEMSEWLR